MKRLLNFRSVITVILLVMGQFSDSHAQNPIIQTIYTADPAPMVYQDTLFLYTGHDEDNSTWFTMKDWRLFSTTDMVNWVDRGSPLSVEAFSWAKKDAWAGQCIYRNGKFYWYVPMNEISGKGMSIGVAVSDSPTGPFKDAIGKPFIHSGNGDIDPTVFIDDDGQAYLYWGNPYLKYVKLNEDMVSFTGDIIDVPLTREGFNVRYKDADKRPSAYEEGPWIYKRNSLYYLLYPAGGVPEHLAYSTSKSIGTEWQYQDTVMTIIQKGGAFTNHPGLVDYKGKSYLFYHNGALPGGGGFTRSVCVDELKFNEDGTIQRVIPTAGLEKGAGNLNPFQRVEAETMAWEEGVETETSNEVGVYVTDISNDDYIKVRNVDFGKGAKKFEASLASIKEDSKIEIHVDSLSGPIITTCKAKETDDLKKWSVSSSKLKRVRKVHDVYLVFKGGEGNLFNFDWWRIQ